uniref:Hypothetical conserved protein n=1 Tax=uncultured Planctomycetota bacterium TaxID=120965 RepID=H5SAT6_9BACT|nr:hypothetical conserved protein [uncultured Planctomycetota bacterium]
MHLPDFPAQTAWKHRRLLATILFAVGAFVVPALPAIAGLTLEQALHETLTRNPQLVTLRGERNVSRAAWWAAQRLPMSLNPVVSIQVSPWTFSGDTRRPLKTIVTLTVLQPVEINGAQRYRVAQARAEYTLAEWQLLMAELRALAETYRLYETAVYRRERCRVTEDLAKLQEQLLETTRRRVESALSPPSDLILTESEAYALRQALLVSRDEYSAAIADLQKQLGLAEYTGTLEIDDPFFFPDSVPEENALLTSVLRCHPEIVVAQAQVAAAQAAWRLARAERIPPVSLGPTYEHNEDGSTFYGLAMETNVPLYNSGREVAYQREAEYRRELTRLEQLRQQTEVRIRVALERFRDTKSRLDEAKKLFKWMEQQIDKLNTLYNAGQTDLLTVLAVRRRFLETQYQELDITWALTQTYADLLEATGGLGLLDDGNESPMPIKRPSEDTVH